MKQKDPSDTRTYPMYWAEELNGQTIATSTWTGDGLTVGTATISGTVTSVVLSGGADESRYEVVNTITTSGGQTLEKSMTIVVRDR